MRLIGYVRVSINEQAENGIILAAQEQKIRRHCKGNRWQCVEVVRDDGYSATNLKCPGLQQISAKFSVRGRRFDGIVVAKLDRLTRSLRDLLRLTDDADKHQVLLVFIPEAVDTGTATGQLFRNIVTSIREWERGIIGERTCEALTYKRRNGTETRTSRSRCRAGEKQFQPGSAALPEWLFKSAGMQNFRIRAQTGDEGAEGGYPTFPHRSSVSNEEKSLEPGSRREYRTVTRDFPIICASGRFGAAPVGRMK